MAKKSSFTRKYFIFLVILFVLVFAVLGVIWVLMKNYQENFHETETRQEWLLSQTAFESYVNDMDIDDWTKLWYDTCPDSLDLEDTVKTILTNRLDGDTNFARAKGYSDEAPVYVIEDETGAIAQFSLEKDAADMWHVTSASIRMTGNESDSITVPSNCTVICGETVLDESYMTDSKEYYSMKDSFGSDVNDSVSLSTYTVSGQLTKPVFTVNTPTDTELSEDYDGKPIVIMCSGTDEIVNKCLSFFDDYMYYGMLGYYNAEINGKAAAAHCRMDSQAQKLIYASISDMRGGASCYSNYTSEVSVGPVIVWGDNALSVDVVFNALGFYRDEEPFVQNGVLRVHVVNYGNGYEICGIENIIAE